MAELRSFRCHWPGAGAMPYPATLGTFRARRLAHETRNETWMQALQWFYMSHHVTRSKLPCRAGSTALQRKCVACLSRLRDIACRSRASKTVILATSSWILLQPRSDESRSKLGLPATGARRSQHGQALCCSQRAWLPQLARCANGACTRHVLSL